MTLAMHMQDRGKNLSLDSTKVWQTIFPFDEQFLRSYDGVTKPEVAPCTRLVLALRSLMDYVGRLKYSDFDTVS